MTQQWIGGVDAHKHSLTVALVQPAGGEVRVASVANMQAGLVEVLAWLTDQPATVVRIGVEGSAGHGRHVAAMLLAAGYDVREVPARPTAQRRRERRRAKTDIDDAYAIARATAGEPSWGRSSPAPGWVPRTRNWSSWWATAACWSSGARPCSTTPKPSWPRCRWR